jgi:hypothetical protein
MESLALRLCDAQERLRYRSPELRRRDHATRHGDFNGNGKPDVAISVD